MMKPTTRRAFLYTSAAATLASRSLAAVAQSSSKLLLVGTQTSGTSKGVYAYKFDTSTGELASIGLAAATDNPTFLVAAPNGKTIVVANETESFQNQKGGSVSTFSLNATTGVLTQISQVASKGGSTCHVTTDHTGSSAFAANYTGGSAVSYHLDATGHLSPPVSFEQYTGHGPNASRQEAPHAHRVTVSPDNKFLLVNDLGLDRIHIYKLDAATGKLTPNNTSWKAPAGSGPRALLFHPSGKYAYCVCEITSQVLVLLWDPATGKLKTTQTLTLPIKAASTADDIVLDKQARFAYVTNRGDDFVATFAVSADGSELAFQRRSSCGGKVPRHLTLDPTEKWLLIANQGSDNIAVFARNPTTGQLAATGKSFAISIPQCLVFPS